MRTNSPTARNLRDVLGIALVLAFAGSAAAQPMNPPPFECDNRFGQCGTPNMSGGGGGGGGGAILVANTDLGDTYQNADDYDNDGAEDNFDNCPQFNNLSQSDGDGDGIGDACDNCRGSANGGLTGQGDLDGDGIGDVCDDDVDGDSLLNVADNCSRIPNPISGVGQPNMDGDAFGDACDDDVDGDGTLNVTDTCPLNASPTATGASCFPDTDGDGISEFDTVHPDKCPTVADRDQVDTDNDGIGDACDPDDDNDNIMDVRDNCGLISNVGQANLDRDRSNNLAGGTAQATFGGDACDTTYCYTVNGDERNCLDPRAALKVYAPVLLATVGRDFRLPIFVNRSQDTVLPADSRASNVSFSYRWEVVSAPPASKSAVRNATGLATEKFRHEYDYPSGAPASFRPDVPGRYQLRITVTGDDADRIGASATFLTEISVNSASGGGGCSISGTPSSSGSTPAAILGMAVAALFVSRRRRA